MCDYCVAVEKKEDEDVYIPCISEKRIGLTVSGVEAIDTGDLAINLDVRIERGGFLDGLLYDAGGEFLFRVINQKINYCPMCGRKF